MRERTDEPTVYDIPSEDERMNWAMEKAKLTLHHFEDSLKKPAPSQQYFSVKVKIVDGEHTEHIWLGDPSFDQDNNLFGVVGNRPIDVSTVKLHQKIGITKDLVSDWMIIKKGRLIGGYTIRAVRDGLEGDALVDFDESLGGIRVDEGEDYFEPNFDTPEGAILALESAYDEDDIEKALACKDFGKEAEIMLTPKIPINPDQEMIDKTAEVLKLSYIQHLKENGMPKFDGVKRAFPDRTPLSENHYLITEVCTYPDGVQSIQQLNTYKTEEGWKVLAPEF
ncbi:MAG: DUF2314 domain-containing protein [Aureispira sp.]|nr:DUF2314 domain-containing protein [Aureispira sp.]